MLENLEKRVYLKDQDLINSLNKKDEYKKIINVFFSRFNNNKKTDIVDTVKYSTGGETIHRGYYCPRPIFELFVTNVNRGRLVDKSYNKINYKYFFDRSNRIIECDKINTDSIGKEFIWYENNIQYAVDIDNFESYPDSISSISKCIYKEEKIVRYEDVMVIDNEPQSHIEIEEYFYNEKGKLDAVLVYIYFEHKQKEYIVNRGLYKLIRDENEKVIQLVANRIDDGKIVSQGTINVPKYKQKRI